MRLDLTNDNLKGKFEIPPAIQVRKTLQTI